MDLLNYRLRFKMPAKKEIHMKSTFKYLLLAYSLSLLLLFFWLQADCLRNKVDKETMQMNLETGYRNTSKDRNITNIRYVYKNVTSIVYINKTVEKIVYKENSVPPRYGPGENGERVNSVIYDKDTINITKLEELKTFHGFDTIMSDTISIHRKMQDFRHPNCKKIKYPDVMPSVSVVIIFRDEWYSILLRTVYSVLQMSPPHLLTEVILVDDGSTDPDLKAKVDLHVANVEKLKLVRNKEPLGIMMARQRGVDATISDHFVVMDGHMEVGPGWLEPLIYRLVQEPNALVCAHVGSINSEDFQYYFDDEQYSMFDSQFPFFDFLTLDQLWTPYSTEFRSARNKSIEPIPYGTVQGGFTAMRKAFFNQLGGYDPGMRVWGTEQMELSIKIWCCGGRVEMAPCSKVAHMYRQTPWTRSQFNTVQYVNKARTLEVWIDSPYKEYVYPIFKYANYSMGNITDRLHIRKENNCKPYKYFLDIVKQFSDVYIPDTPSQKGAVKNILYSACLDISQLNRTVVKLKLYGCHGIFNQFFLLTEVGEIRSTNGRILNVVEYPNTNSTYIEVVTSPSTVRHGNYKWRFENGKIINVNTGLCIEATSRTDVNLRSCTNDNGGLQSWIWGNLV